MMHGLSNGTFLDDKRFWPIYERAEALDVPIYFHPATPDPRGRATSTMPTTPRTSRWWCGRPGATRSRPRPTAIRLVLSGRVRRASEAEGGPRPSRRDAAVPGVARRPGASKRPGAAKKISFRDIFSGNFYMTTSGFSLRSGADVLRAGDGRRPHPCSRSILAVRHQQAGGLIDEQCAAVGVPTARRFSRRQCEDAVEDEASPHPATLPRPFPARGRVKERTALQRTPKPLPFTGRGIRDGELEAMSNGGCSQA